MEDRNLEKLLLSAKQGNEIAREQLIKYYQPYVLNTVGHICKRYVSWSDEEASVALIAFNKAIDTFEQNKGRTFLNYGFLLIQRELIDFFRKERKEKHESFEYATNEEPNPYHEVKQSIDDYKQKVYSSEIVDEILELNTILNQFKISFEQLEKYSPKHVDTRENLLNIASEFTKDNTCVSELFQKRRLPMKRFAEMTDTRVKTLERHRKYLITLIIIMLHPEWVYLSQFIKKGGES